MYMLNKYTACPEQLEIEQEQLMLYRSGLGAECAPTQPAPEEQLVLKDARGKYENVVM